MSIQRLQAAFELDKENHKIPFHCGNAACELGEAIGNPIFFKWARKNYVTAFQTNPEGVYVKEVTEKALSLMERAEKV